MQLYIWNNLYTLYDFDVIVVMAASLDRARELALQKTHDHYAGYLDEDIWKKVIAAKPDEIHDVEIVFLYRGDK